MNNNRCSVCTFSTAGLAHLQRGKDCEDAVHYEAGPDGTCAVAMCDGAGSAAFAKDGAEICSKEAARLAAGSFDLLYRVTGSKREELIVNSVVKLLFQRALELNCDISELSCTLLLAAYAPDGRAFLLHIGDGLILGRTCGGEIQLLSRYEHEFLNATKFVTSGRTRCITRTFRNINGFLLMTDGVSEGCMLNSDGAPRQTAQMMMQLSYLLPQEQMQKEYDMFSKRLQRAKHAAFDDISIASLSDRQQAAQVLCELKEPFRSRLFGLPQHLNQRMRKQYSALTSALYKKNGLTAAEAASILHCHSRSVAKKRLERMRNKKGCILQYEAGRYFVPE